MEKGRLTFLICSMCFVSIACRPNPPPPAAQHQHAQQPSTDTHPPGPTIKPVQPPPGPPSLAITRTEFLHAAGQYWLKATLRNNGPGTAYFSGGCTWKCPGGLTLSGGADIIQGGVLVAGRELPYEGIASGMCAGPPAQLQTDCSLRVHAENGTETALLNWSPVLPVPR